MTSCTEADDVVTVEVDGEGGRTNVRARYLVGCDGGRSTTRRLMGVSFDGTTSPTRWLVVDVANDPLGHPNSEVGADPLRPYASCVHLGGDRETRPQPVRSVGLCGIDDDRMTFECVATGSVVWFDMPSDWPTMVATATAIAKPVM